MNLCAINSTRTRDVASVRRSRVVLTPRRWCQGCGCYVGPTGCRQTSVRKRRWQESPVTEERKISRKAIACGDAGWFRCTRCYACAFHHYNMHTRPRVQRASGIPHTLQGGRTFHQRLGGLRRMSANQLPRYGTGWWAAADRAYALSSSAPLLEMRAFEPAGCRLQQIPGGVHTVIASQAKQSRKAEKVDRFVASLQ